MKNIRVTMLVENTAQGPGMLAEHGLAYWIEHNGKHILLDSGQGGALLHNAFRLGIALHDLDALVLSHGHYDHTGGVSEALKETRPVTVFAHPAAFAKKYVRHNNGTSREIGLPRSSEVAIHNARNRLVSVTGPTEVFDGLMVTGPVPRATDFEDTGGQFFLDEACTQPDPLEDDQSVYFDTPQGLVVLLGCAHSGVINTLRYIGQLTDNRPIHTVIGGMHLVGASQHRIERTIEEFQRIGVERLMPGHCTGMAATVALWNAFPGRCEICPAGTKLEF